MKSFFNIAKKILLWGLAVLFLSGGLAYFPGVSGIIAFLLFALILPVQKWQSVLGKVINGKAKAILAVVLAIAMFATAPSAPEAENGDAAPTGGPMITAAGIPEATSEPAASPTDAPTTIPTEEPTAAPTAQPTATPTAVQTEEATATPTAQPTATPTRDPNRDYVLNTSTKKFHYPSCNSVDDIKASNKKEYHGTRDELIPKGYDPCGRCHP